MYMPSSGAAGAHNLFSAIMRMGQGGISLPGVPGGALTNSAPGPAPPPVQVINYMGILQGWAGGLLGQSNPGNLGANFLSSLPQLAGQLTQNPLIQGLLGFAFNTFMRRDQALPSKDNAVDVRVINFPKGGPEYSAVRDKSELAFAAEQQARYDRGWGMQGAAQRAG